ncbi:MAG: glycosyltransferase [Flavobacteriales bacterium]|nr:PGL/p-HBAD biosynthesis glycosyltransferase [Flavobacteriales bacterium]MCC6577295.1 glycosyltransferase [Flavobacteriales bacterium]NUQ13736.1 glycosyltransferase [Flavobacteriales bacterium]
MKFTLITVCYKAGDELAQTVDSVRAQTHPDIEHIIVDGASPDAATQEVLRRIDDGRALVISEPDRGVYDAMNKGLARATGEVVGFVNAGDLLEGPEVIAALAAEFAHGDADVLYGDANMVDPQDIRMVRRFWKGGAYHRDNFRKGWMPPHLGTYIRRAAYGAHGGFDLRFRIAADYELMFRFLYKHGLRARYVPLTIVRFRLGGASNKSLGHVWKANREVLEAWRANGLKPPPLLAFRKPLRKLAQYILPSAP